MEQESIHRTLGRKLTVATVGIGLALTIAAAPQGKGGGGTTPAPNPEIAFADVGLKVMNSDGTNVRTVVTQKKGELVRGPVWSPDGQALAYFGVHSGAVGIYTVRLDGTQRTRIVALPSDSLSTFPDWSRSPGPTGQRMLVFAAKLPEVGEYELYVANPDGSNLTNISQTPDDSEFDCAWSSDGSRIYVSRMFRNGSFPPQYELWEIVIRLDSSGNVVKASESVVVPASNSEFIFPRSANTFEGLVFSNLFSSATLGVHSMDLSAASPSPVRVTSGNDRWASFSPDDSKIAFHQSGSGGGIYTINRDGTGKVRISSKGADPNWKRPPPAGP